MDVALFILLQRPQGRVFESSTLEVSRCITLASRIHHVKVHLFGGKRYFVFLLFLLLRLLCVQVLLEIDLAHGVLQKCILIRLAFLCSLLAKRGVGWRLGGRIGLLHPAIFTFLTNIYN